VVRPAIIETTSVVCVPDITSLMITNYGLGWPPVSDYDHITNPQAGVDWFEIISEIHDPTGERPLTLDQISSRTKWYRMASRCISARRRANTRAPAAMIRTLVEAHDNAWAHGPVGLG